MTEPQKEAREATPPNSAKELKRTHAFIVNVHADERPARGRRILLFDAGLTIRLRHGRMACILGINARYAGSSRFCGLFHVTTEWTRGVRSRQTHAYLMRAIIDWPQYFAMSSDCMMYYAVVSAFTPDKKSCYAYDILRKMAFATAVQLKILPRDYEEVVS